MKTAEVIKAGVLVVLASTIVGGLFVGTFASAQAAGAIDTTFGTGGTVSTNVASPELFPLGAFEQTNGDIVVVSTFDDGTTLATNIGLVRYTSAGKLDTTFGTKGITVTEFPNVNTAPVGFAVLPNGDILVAATATVDLSAGEFALARYTANGILDTTFGTKGTVLTPFATNNTASALLLQPNGQFVVGGLQGPSSKTGAGAGTVLVRYNANGSLDTTFGSDGIDVAPNPVLGAPEELALLSNGNYLALGNNAIAEFSSTGAFVPTVTLEPFTATSTPVSGCCSPSILEPNGDFLVASIFGTGRHLSDDEVTRFTATGAVDGTFTPTPVKTGPGENEPQFIVLQTNGQILVGGLTNASQSPVEGGFARLNTNGSVDTTFGTDGAVSTTAPLASLLVQTNGNIVAIGSSGEDLVLSRYLGQ